MLERYVALINSNDRSTALNAPASRYEISKAEERIGVEFPDQLINLYTEANGESGKLLSSSHDLKQFFYSFDFLSLDGLVDEHNLNSEAYPTYFGENNCYPEGYIKKAFFNKNWIPFAFAGSAINMAIDMDPGEKGTVGQVIVYGADVLPYYFVLSPDLEALIESLVIYVTRIREIADRNSTPYYEPEYDYSASAHIFYESEEWRKYSEDEFKYLLQNGALPFWNV